MLNLCVPCVGLIYIFLYLLVVIVTNGTRARSTILRLPRNVALWEVMMRVVLPHPDQMIWCMDSIRRIRLPGPMRKSEKKCKSLSLIHVHLSNNIFQE
jgi:hypothetical protein